MFNSIASNPRKNFVQPDIHVLGGSMEYSSQRKSSNPLLSKRTGAFSGAFNRKHNGAELANPRYRKMQESSRLGGKDSRSVRSLRETGANRKRLSRFDTDRDSMALSVVSTNSSADSSDGLMCLDGSLERDDTNRRRSSFTITSRKVGSEYSNKRGRGFGSHIQTIKGLRSKVSLLLDQVLEARKKNKCPIASQKLIRLVDATETMVSLSGGTPVVKQGIMKVIKSHVDDKGRTNFATQGKGSLILPSFRKQLVQVRDGKLIMYSVPKRFNPSSAMLDEDDIESLNMRKVLEVKMVHLEMLYYPERGSKYFVLVAMQPVSMGDGTLPPAHRSFREELYFIRADTGKIAEEWISVILREFQNQAILHDRYSDVLRMTPDASDETIDTFLRTAVDMWTMAKGPNHRLVKDARDRLVEWLEQNPANFEEARFWSELSDHTIENEEVDSALNEIRSELESSHPELNIKKVVKILSPEAHIL